MATQTDLSRWLDSMSPESRAIYRRRTFMLAHDHLIVPWRYTPKERQERDMQLAALNWQRNTRNEESSDDRG